MNELGTKIHGMVKVSFFMNLIFLIIGLAGVINKTSFMIVVIMNIIMFGSIFILKKNEHLIGGVIEINKLAKGVNSLIK